MQSSDNILGQIKLTKTVTYLCSDSLSCDIFCPFFFFSFSTVPVPVTSSQWMVLTIIEKTGAFAKTFFVTLYRN